MKLVGHVNAIASLREAIEEYGPEQGATQNEIIETVRAAYGFQSYPQLGPEPAYAPQLLFLNGRYTKGDTSFAIAQLVMEPNGDTVATVTTDQAETFLRDLTATLDRELGFRFGASPKPMSFVSNVVVEFEDALENHIVVLKRITNLVASALPGREPLGLKRLAMGVPNLRVPTNQIETIESTDFIIERRAGTAFDQNRYYCSAPMKSADHIRLLEQIEGILLSP